MIDAIKITFLVLFILGSFFYMGYCSGQAVVMKKYSDKINEICKKMGIKEAE